MFSMICWGKPAETKLCFPRTLWFNEEKEHFPCYLGAGGGQGFFSFLNFYLLLEYTWLMMLCEFQVYHSIIQLYIYTKVKVLAAQSYLTLLWPHELWPTRFLCPWDSPGKKTGMGSQSPGALPDQGIEPRSPASQTDSLPYEPLKKPHFKYSDVTC